MSLPVIVNRLQFFNTIRNAQTIRDVLIYSFYHNFLSVVNDGSMVDR